MADIIDFRNEKSKPFLDRVIAGAMVTGLHPTAHELKVLYAVIEDVYNQGFDDRGDYVSPEVSAAWERDEKLSTLRRTALELAKANVLPLRPGTDKTYIRDLLNAAVDFESGLKERVVTINIPGL